VEESCKQILSNGILRLEELEIDLDTNETRMLQTEEETSGNVMQSDHRKLKVFGM
jgi:hypothetical protein